MKTSRLNGALPALVLMACQAVADDPGVPDARFPPPECHAWTGYDRDAYLPGYRLPSVFGPETCVAFAATAVTPPPDYTGGDFYVDEFTDVKLRQRWRDCQTRPDCAERLNQHVDRRQPPNREHGITDQHDLWLLGAIDSENPALDLHEIRRPRFFARDPWQEPIATAEDQTFTVEFTVEPEPYERLVRKRTAPVKLRGWYVKGKGIDDGAGGRKRALILMSNGGGGRLVAIEHPSDRLYHLDPATGRSVLNRYPAGSTGASGQRDWRQFIFELHQAGFDVLSYDRRGVGLSGGFSDTNTLQQGRDILTVISSLSSGEGVRLLTPDGNELRGLAATGALMAGVNADQLPVMLAGSSRGTMATGWAMTRNFDRACDYDLPDMPCAPAAGLSNIKGAMLLASFVSGPGYLTWPTTQSDTDRGLFIGGSELRYHIVFFPSSAVLAGIHTWPALFIGRGLWDYAESLRGSIDAYDRVSGLKELVVVRAPHPFEVWPEAERERVAARMIAFARAAVLGWSSVPGGRPWSTMKELVATSSDLWEVSSFPRR